MWNHLPSSYHNPWHEFVNRINIAYLKVVNRINIAYIVVVNRINIAYLIVVNRINIAYLIVGKLCLFFGEMFVSVADGNVCYYWCYK